VSNNLSALNDKDDGTSDGSFTIVRPNEAMRDILPRDTKSEIPARHEARHDILL
jgi:hypothetical protein